jgi:hypothetical protein
VTSKIIEPHQPVSTGAPLLDVAATGDVEIHASSQPLTVRFGVRFVKKDRGSQLHSSQRYNDGGQVQIDLGADAVKINHPGSLPGVQDHLPRASLWRWVFKIAGN